jgi:hypothetical protein
MCVSTFIWLETVAPSNLALDKLCYSDLSIIYGSRLLTGMVADTQDIGSNSRYEMVKEIALAVLQYLQNSANSSLDKAKQLSRIRTFRTSSHRLSERHALLDLSNGQSRVQALGASPAAVQDGVATVQAHAVVEAVHTLSSFLVTRVGDPAVRLHKHGRTEVLLAVPPV